MKYLLLIAVEVFLGTVAAGQSNLPLDQAAREGNLVEVKRLLEQGSDPNKINKWGTTALTGASTLGSDSEAHTEIVRILLIHGAEVNARVAGGSTAINEASFWGHESTVRVLLDAKSHVDSPKDNGYTALLSAASRGHLSIVKLLIASGADGNHQTPSGLTALHLASSDGHSEIVKALLDSGVRPDIKNIRGETYQDVAGRSTALQTAMKKAVGSSSSEPDDETGGSYALLMVSLALTWTVGLFPSLLAKYVLKLTPLEKGPAIAFAGAWCLVSVIGWAAVAGSTTRHVVQIVIAYVTYRILRSGNALEQHRPLLKGANGDH